VGDRRRVRAEGEDERHDLRELEDRHDERDNDRAEVDPDHAGPGWATPQRDRKVDDRPKLT
jgi:hypothetical protein